MPFFLFAVSDATGGLANDLAVSAYRQFEGIDAKIIRRGRVTTEKKVKEVISDAKSKDGVILFTMVSQALRRMMLDEAKKENVIAMDVMGPALDMLALYFHKLPSDEPGLQYRETQNYFNRVEAVEFAVRHDEGLDVDGFDKADLVLLGISRTSKTPLSIYLALQGLRCANYPLVAGMELPAKILELDRKKLVGLVVHPEKLSLMRTERLKNLGRPNTEDYAQETHIQKEMEFAQRIFTETLGGIYTVDVTGKAIEEVASEIIQQRQLG